MKPLIILAFAVLAACTNPMLSTDLVFGADGVSVNPTLSGNVGNATVSVESN